MSDRNANFESTSVAKPGIGAAARSSAPGRLSSVWQSVSSDRGALLGLTIIAVFLLFGVFADLIAPYGPNRADPVLRLKPPGTPGHWLGLDGQGRDILTRLIHGSRASLYTGVVPVAIGMCVAVPLGMLAAYYRRAGHVIMRVMDVLFAFPMVLLAIMFAAFLGPGIGNLVLALVLVLIPYNTRVAYVEALAQLNAGYIEAARAAGTSDFNILFKEMLPHVVAASVVYSMTIVGTIIITAAGLSFLGLGVQPPTAEWGIMTSEGRTVLHIAPHVATLPGLAIFLLVTGFNLIGDAVRDALDPRTRRNHSSST